MKLTEYIAGHIIEVYIGGNWTEVDIAATLQDVSFIEAATKTQASPNSIAMLLHHLTFYNNVAAERPKGNNPAINEANGFDVPAVTSAANWVKIKEANIQSATNLAEAVKQFPEEKLQQLTASGASTYYKLLHGIAEHAHYHLGQIVILKKLLRANAQL